MRKSTTSNDSLRTIVFDRELTKNSYENMGTLVEFYIKEHYNLKTNFIMEHHYEHLPSVNVHFKELFKNKKFIDLGKEMIHNAITADDCTDGESFWTDSKTKERVHLKSSSDGYHLTATKDFMTKFLRTRREVAKMMNFN